MILGERNELTQELNNYFSNSGVIHIISISGTHIALLSALIFQLFLLLGWSRQKSFNFIVVILVCYLFLIGFNAPAIRSALMGLILAFAQKEGRLGSAGRAVVASAVFLLLLNPRLLLGDIGFQLSFLAVFGLVYISPYFSHWLRRIFKNKELRSVLAMTLAAQAITWPLTVWRFQTVSLIAPLTNVLILAVPAVEILMVAGFLFIIMAGLGLGAPLIFLFSAPVYLSANYVIYVSEWCAKIPFSHLPINNFNFLWVLVSYAVMGMIYFLVRKRVELEE
jgi:competence protein ComEC